MSHPSQGPGWWQASDGKWHAPTPSKPRHTTTATTWVAHASAEASTEDTTAEIVQRTRVRRGADWSWSSALRRSDMALRVMGNAAAP